MPRREEDHLNSCCAANSLELTMQRAVLTSREAFWIPVESTISSNFKWGKTICSNTKANNNNACPSHNSAITYFNRTFCPCVENSLMESWTGRWNLISVFNIPSVRLERSGFVTRMSLVSRFYHSWAEVQRIVCTTERIIGCQLPPEIKCTKLEWRGEQKGLTLMLHTQTTNLTLADVPLCSLTRTTICPESDCPSFAPLFFVSLETEPEKQKPSLAVKQSYGAL